MEPSELFSKALGIFWVVIFFGGSIFVHELGHFLAAKWRGLHIERFSIGFGPKIVSWTRGGVEYRLSWLPLGGYVALPQLADMRGIEGDSSLDLKALPPIGYLDKVIVAVAGAVFNVIFALFLASILFFTGRPSSEELASTEIGYVSPSLETAAGEVVTGPAFKAGLQRGDIIKAIDGKPIRNWENVHEAVALSVGVSESGSRAIDFTIEREGQIQHVEVTPILSADRGFRQIGISPGYKVYIHGVAENSPAQRAGLQAGDAILAADGTPIRNARVLIDYIGTKKDQSVKLSVERPVEGQAEPQLLDVAVTPIEKLRTKSGDSQVLIGVGPGPAQGLIKQTPWEQLKNIANSTLKTLKALLHKDSDVGVKQMSGPVEIVRIIYTISQYSFLQTLWIVIIINVSLAFFNLLPIPVLDGGHIVFATFAKLRGKPLNPNFIASTQGTFMIMLFGLMIYISYFNITNWSKDASEAKAREDDRIPLEFTDADYQPSPAQPDPVK